HRTADPAAHEPRTSSGAAEALREAADPVGTLETRIPTVQDAITWMTFATRPGACGTADLLVLRAADRNVAVRGGRMDVGYSRRAADNWNAVPSCAQGLLRVRLEMADGRVRSLSGAIVDAAPEEAVDAGEAAGYLLSVATSSPEPVALLAMTAAVLAAAPVRSGALLSIAEDARRPDAVRAFAARWLGHAGDASIAPALERMARGASTPHAVHLAAVDALGALGGGTGSPHLARLRDDAPDDRVRQAAARQWDLVRARLPAPGP
ncbi:MAG TPA: HEAT repeat domain-containing protein, partial [Longimicrobium sp.]|nr:HEAT repeat domain-containing protein [Longimicrobium sp.]